MVRVHHYRTSRPGADPWSSVDQNAVVTPAETDTSPAPGSKCCSDRDGGAEPNRSSNIETGPRTHEDYARIVDRDCIIPRGRRNDLDAARSVIDHLIVLSVPQIAIVIGLLPHALNGIHHVASLRQNGCT